MAEVLVAVGGIVSITQLFLYIIKTTRAVNDFCNTFQDAPAQIHSVEEKLCTLKNVLEGSQIDQQIFHDETVLPRGLRQTLFEAVKRTNETIIRLKDSPELKGRVSSRDIRRKLKWAAIAKHKIGQELHQLELCEELLDKVIQLINLRSSLLGLTYAKQSTDAVQALNRNLGIALERGKDREILFGLPIKDRKGNRNRNTSLTRWTQAIINADSWLRGLGFYGSFTLITEKEEEAQGQVRLGFKLPSWISSISVDVQFEFSRLVAKEIGLRILYGEIKLQNRVSDNSPFMSACRDGDIRLMKQYMEEKTGSIRDKTICTGSTPLLLAIEGKHFQAIEFLLESGADPNISNDDQILPLFAIMGTSRPRGNEWIGQIPPTWSLWLDVFRLLVDQGASVHEINAKKSLVHLNISHGSPGLELDYPEPSALEFYQILHDQSFIDFGVPGPDLWNPVLTAIRRRTHSTETLKFLSKMGINLSRIAMTGHSSLHWAAEMAYEIECLEFLCTATASENINRQDAWGWTPLHYAVASGRYGYQNIALHKFRCLLKYGADPDMKGRKHPIFFAKVPLADEFTPLEMSLQTNSDFSTLFEEELNKAKFKDVILNHGVTFYDAVEFQ